MANNCLETKLLGEVQNGNLQKVGFITISAIKKNTITAPEKEQVILLKYESGTTGVVSVSSPGALSANPATVDQSTTTSMNVGSSTDSLVAFKNETYNIDLSEKYKLVDFYGRAESGKTAIFVFDLSVFDYAEKLTYLRILYFNKITGRIDSLKHCELLTNISLYACDNVVGNIESLGKLTSLTELTLGWTKCKGEINTLAAEQVVNGRTSGTLSINCNGRITLDGIAVPNLTTKTITFDSSLPNGYSIA